MPICALTRSDSRVFYIYYSGLPWQLAFYLEALKIILLDLAAQV